MGDDVENNGKALGGVDLSRNRLERRCLIGDMVSLQGKLCDGEKAFDARQEAKHASQRPPLQCIVQLEDVT